MERVRLVGLCETCDVDRRRMCIGIDVSVHHKGTGEVNARVGFDMRFLTHPSSGDLHCHIVSPVVDWMH